MLSGNPHQVISCLWKSWEPPGCCCKEYRRMACPMSLHQSCARVWYLRVPQVDLFSCGQMEYGLACLQLDTIGIYICSFLRLNITP